MEISRVALMKAAGACSARLTKQLGRSFLTPLYHSHARIAVVLKYIITALPARRSKRPLPARQRE